MYIYIYMYIHILESSVRPAYASSPVPGPWLGRPSAGLWWGIPLDPTRASKGP